MTHITLIRGKDKSVLRKHPWIFAASVSEIEGRAKAGDTIEVRDYRGKPFGKAAWSPESQIRARMWTFDPDESVDDAFFKRRIAAAVARRQAIPALVQQQGIRLIHAESDGLPGVIADQYQDTVVIQLTSAGANKWRNAIVNALIKATDCKKIFERSDSEIRGLENLGAITGWLYGEDCESAPPLIIEENGIKMLVDIKGGHKTGFYLDQRDNRKLLGDLSKDKTVLNCFCYTAGFSLQALAGGASKVVSIDSSTPALATAQQNLALNPGLDANRAEWRCANVFDELRRLQPKGESPSEIYDIIILDPPKFAPSTRHTEQAGRAYKDININGFKLLAPGGLLFTYSCSGGISIEFFQQIVTDAARDAGRTARIVQRLQGAADHPIDLNFPEGEYLKGLLIQVE